jgi:hypothetical protein
MTGGAIPLRNENGDDLPAIWFAASDPRRDNRTAWRRPLRRHTRCLQIVWRLLASWIAPPTVPRIRRLQLSRECECRARPLVLDDRAERHRLDFVEHPERQRDPFVPDRKAPVRVVHYLDLLARQPARERRRDEPA